MAWRRVDMIEHDVPAVGPPLSHRAPAHVIHDEPISVWSQTGPVQYICSDLGPDHEIDAEGRQWPHPRW